ncbi:hypothetical protein JIQ42_04587 [Leishmania sp. Namibia]|uniref:hypothetical protein n=1 Tax=Leishmania sp. Namibia TaxID=2802991 RepID=UPI001B431ED9|nr:hypothetical protein JIQ42_04587 [Leishmania sp. Namibia]
MRICRLFRRTLTLSAAPTRPRSRGAAATAGSLLLQRRTIGHSSPPPGPLPSLPSNSNTSSNTVGSQSPVAHESSASGRSASCGGPPSLESVLVELRTLVTRMMPVGELFRALSPASRRILVAHRLPLEELLLNLPNHFLVHRVGGKQPSSNATLQVAPPSCARNSMEIMRLPPGTKPLPALEQWLGPQKAREVATPSQSVMAGSSRIGAGNGFVDGNVTLKERLEEVLTYIPNEWTPFSVLNIPREVKMRCMGYPHVRPSAFLLKYPQFFDVRVQDQCSNTFHVRRTLSLQQQLKSTRKP